MKICILLNTIYKIQYLLKLSKLSTPENKKLTAHST